MRKLRMLMMMGCIPMILGAEEYKEPEKINLNKGWEKASGFLQKFPEQYIRI